VNICILTCVILRRTVMNDREFLTYNVEDFDILSGIVHFNLTIILIF